MFLSNNLFKISRVDGCILKNVGELSFDFVDGACNSFNFDYALKRGEYVPQEDGDPIYVEPILMDPIDMDEEVWLCFDSSNDMEEAQKCYS